MCANALEPTYGWRLYGGTLVTSLIAWASRVASRSRSGATTSWPDFSWRFETTVRMSALPVRSPYPFTVPCTWLAPASIAASELATAQPVSLWQWMPSRALVEARTSATTSCTCGGSIPPLVSQRATTSAPASAATRTASSA